MKNLSFNTLEEKGYNGYLLKDAPERILQFGEGNFLRGFVDFFINEMNEKSGFNSKVVIVQPIKPINDFDFVSEFNKQDALYTLYLRGYKNKKIVNNKKVISSINRCLNSYIDYEKVMQCAQNRDLRFIVCNTTEAGIVYDENCKFEETPPSSFPAKLTKFLYERYINFKNEQGKGFIILSCELIDNNGKELKKCVLKYIEQWKLEDEFKQWVLNENEFCSTLVDRIVTGYPKNEIEKLEKENNYIDKFLDAGEIFGLWVIEGSKKIEKELPFKDINLPIKIVDDCTAYKQIKVRILNGAHTSIALGAYLCGKELVRDCMEDDVIFNFIRKIIFEEINPTLDFTQEEILSFSNAVIERFKNPFIDHTLLSISLNSTSKWKVRVLPSILEYLKRKGVLPKYLVMSLAFYIAFYSGKELVEDALIAKRNNNEYKVLDDKEVLKFFYEHRNDNTKDLVHYVMSNTSFWDMDLTKIKNFEVEVVKYLDIVKEKGVYELIKNTI